jgi:hypothetical protein
MDMETPLITRTMPPKYVKDAHFSAQVVQQPTKAKDSQSLNNHCKLPIKMTATTTSNPDTIDSKTVKSDWALQLPSPLVPVQNLQPHNLPMNIVQLSAMTLSYSLFNNMSQAMI